jgi:hypothetical protein
LPPVSRVSIPAQLPPAQAPFSAAEAHNAAATAAAAIRQAQPVLVAAAPIVAQAAAQSRRPTPYQTYDSGLVDV